MMRLEVLPFVTYFFKVDFQNLHPEFKICMWLFELIDFLNIIVHYQVVLDKIRKILLGLLYFTALSKKTVLIILQFSLKNLLAPLNNIHILWLTENF